MACEPVFVLFPELTRAPDPLLLVAAPALLAVSGSVFFSSVGLAVFLGTAFAVSDGVFGFSVFDVLAVASFFWDAGAVTSVEFEAYLAA